MPDREELKDAIRRAGSKELRSALTAAAPPPDRRNRTLNWRGPWQPETTYQAGDVVSHEGSSWRALGESQGSPPPSMLWEYVAKKGERGPSGAGITGPQGPPGPGAIFGSPVASVFGDTGADGASGDASRANHIHDRSDDAVLFYGHINL